MVSLLHPDVLRAELKKLAEDGQISVVSPDREEEVSELLPPEAEDQADHDLFSYQVADLPLKEFLSAAEPEGAAYRVPDIAALIDEG